MEKDYGRYLERLARKLVAGRRRSDWRTDPIHVVEREITLTLYHIDQVRDLYKIQMNKILRLECKIGTQIKQLYPKTPYSSDTRWPDRQRLHNRVLKLEEERRKLRIAKHQQLQSLHEQLLRLINRHRQL